MRKTISAIITLTLFTNAIVIADDLTHNRKEYNKLSEEINKENEKVLAYNLDIEKLLEEINKNEQEIEQIRIHIQRINEDILEIEKEIQKMNELVDSRVRESYKNNIYFSLVTYILSTDLNTLFRNIDWIKMLIDNDKKIIKEINEKKKEQKDKISELVQFEKDEKISNNTIKKDKDKLNDLLNKQLELIEALKIKRDEFDKKYLSISEMELIKWHISIIRGDNSSTKDIYEATNQLQYLKNQIISPIVLSEIDKLLEESSEKIKNISINTSSVLEYGMQFIGWSPYIWGGTDPNIGADCSGFTSYCFLQVTGIWINRTTWEQMTVGIEVAYDELQIGDLVFTEGGSHVGIYAGGGNMLHSPQPGEYVKISPIYNYYCSRRVL